MDFSCPTTCHLPCPSPFLTSIILYDPTQNKSPHKWTLTAGPSCLSATCNCMHVPYRVRCSTDSTLPLALSTQSVDRAADGTEVCRSPISVICEELFDLIAAVILGAILRSNKSNGYIPCRIYAFTTLSGWFRVIRRNVSDQVAVDIRSNCVLISSSEILPFLGKYRKICYSEKDRRQYSVASALCLLDKWGKECRHTSKLLVFVAIGLQ